MNTGLWRQLLPLFESVAARGGLSPYPPPLEPLPPPDDIQRAINAQDGPQPTFAYMEGHLLPHPEGFSLQIRKSSIDHPESGYGVFLHGTCLPGTVVGLYPGTVYQHGSQLTPEVITDNSYLISRYDGVIVDGRRWDQKASELFDARLRASYVGNLSDEDDALFAAGMKRFENPFGIINYVNHPPPGKKPNVMCIGFDFMLDPEHRHSLPKHLQPYLPNTMLKPAFNFFPEQVFMRTVVCVSLRHIQDEELLFNYR
eukprot:TRINITY_DN10994_c0_g1_i1.p1 TRINITY_DN10994_c0_g1~~TRINITY_DN10994_c0_g1_i1.p1  ORF type:complete len:256 (-),score=54.35 TRINITY_DN10994_c0_g1_i1:134-901(-)